MRFMPIMSFNKISRLMVEPLVSLLMTSMRSWVMGVSILCFVADRKGGITGVQSICFYWNL